MMKSSVLLVICFAFGFVNITARPATEKDKEKKGRTVTTILTKSTPSTVHKNDLNKLRFAIKHQDEEKMKNKAQENLEFKRGNISDNEIFEHVTGKEYDIDERALVFIEQRYKVPFLHTVQQKYMPKNLNNQMNYRTFLSNTDSNEDLRQIIVHRFPENKRPPIRSHKDIYMGDKATARLEDIYLKEYNNMNILMNSKDDDHAYTRNMKKKVNIINSNIGHRYNDNSMKDELINMDMDHYGRDSSPNHDRLLREQLITFKDHYRRAQDHENRERQLLNDIKAIKADIDTISAEHRDYLGLLKVPLVKQVRPNSPKEFPKFITKPELESLAPQESLKNEYKTVLSSVTQFYAPPTSIAIKSSPRSPTIVVSNPVEKELPSVIQPAYLSNPPDIDFHDSRILSKIDEMNSISASMEKDKRSSSIATFSRSAENSSNKTTRASEMKMACVYPDCLKQWTPSSTTCDCQQKSSSSSLSLKTDSESAVSPKASTELLDVLQLL